MTALRWSLCGVGLLSFLAPVFCRADETAAAQAESLVREALDLELSGQSASREAILQEALANDPDSALANAYSGRLRYQNEWVNLAELQGLAAGDAVRREYEVLRATAGKSADDLWKLSIWCKRHGLLAEREALLYAVLHFEPNHAAARAELGYVRGAYQWYTRAEIDAAREENNAQIAALRKWQPKLAEIKRRLESPHPKTQLDAREKLLAIDDVEAIFSLELVLSAAKEEHAELVMDVLTEMPQTEATISLARHAVFAPWDKTREIATGLIRMRPESEYVPLLISAMTTPWTESERFEAAGNNGIRHTHVLFRECFDKKQVETMNTVFNGTVPAGQGRVLPPGWQWLIATMARDSDELAEQRGQIAERNAQIKLFNERVTTVLANVTGEELGAEPQPWWEWWNAKTDVYQGEKPVESRAYRRSVTVAAPGPRSSCFAAGTLVWTITGPRPIERIAVGDCVAAQDVATGELVVRPVLLATVRPPRELVRVDLGNQKISSTPGHLFWVVGAGWKRADALVEGDRIYGAPTSGQVVGIEPGETEKAYNLVVEGSHTYFVGQHPLLVHDYTPTPLVTQPLPGLAAKD